MQLFDIKVQDILDLYVMVLIFVDVLLKVHLVMYHIQILKNFHESMGMVIVEDLAKLQSIFGFPKS